MTNEMIALEKTYPREGLWQVTAPVPEIGPDDVLIRINKTGICGTDIHIWNWDDWAAKTVPTPLITGHEFAGEIVEIGSNVTDLALGQRCSGEGHLIGKSSRQSRAGKFHLDPATRGIGVNEQGPLHNTCACPRSTWCHCRTRSATILARYSTRWAMRFTPRSALIWWARMCW